MSKLFQAGLAQYLLDRREAYIIEVPIETP